MVFCGLKFYECDELYYVMGNSVQSDGTIWCMKASDLSRINMSADDIEHDGNTYLDEICALCWNSIEESKVLMINNNPIPVHFSDCAWWLGFYYEGKKIALSSWLYVLAVRLDEDAFGWVLDRLHDDISLILRNSNVSHYEKYCLDEIDEFYGENGSIQDAINKVANINNYHKGMFSPKVKFKSRSFSFSWNDEFKEYFQSRGYSVNTQSWIHGAGYIGIGDYYLNSDEKVNYILTDFKSCEDYIVKQIKTVPEKIICKDGNIDCSYDDNLPF